MFNQLKTALVGASALAVLAAPAFAQDKISGPDINVSTQKETSRVPTWVFGKQPFMRSPRISPDGTKLAFQVSRDGKAYLAWMDLTTPNAPTNVFMANDEYRDVGDRTVGAWRWVGNNNIVVTVASRENLFGQRVDLTRLVAYDIVKKKSTPLAWDKATGSAANILHIDHDKGKLLVQRQSNAYGTERWQLFEVVSVDVVTGKYNVVQQPNPIVDGWMADGSGVIRAATGSDADSGKERLLYRSTGKDQIKTVSNEADKSFTGSNINPEIFLDEPDTAITLSNKDGFRKVYKVNMKTMQLTEPAIFGKTGYDVENALHRNFDGNKLIGVRVTERRERDYWFDPDWKVIQQVMDEQFGKGNAQIVSRDRKDERLVFFVAKDAEPGSFYLFDTRTGKLSVLGNFHPLLKSKQMNPMSTITYTASDGLQIPAVVTMPRHRIGVKNLPLIVMPHGGPFGIRDQEEFGFFPWHQAMAELGYVVIQPNYRGSGGYGKEFVKKGRAPGGYGMRMQDDLNDVLTWFGKQGTIDPKRACIMGWSYGGYATARGAQRDGDKWKCAIAGAGVYDFPKMKAYDQRVFGDFGAKFQATEEGSKLIEISSARNPGGKWAPIMIVAGVRDARIPLEQSRTLVSALKGAGKKEGVDFEYIEQKQGTHNLPYEDVHVEWLEAAERWAQRFNPAYIATDPDKPLPESTEYGPRPAFNK